MITWYYGDAGLCKVSIDATAFDSLISIGAIIISIVAIVVSNRIAITQNKIALMEKRIEILSEFERMVYKRLASWEWTGDCSSILQYSSGQIKCLFDRSFSEFYQELLCACERINIINGDIDHAIKHGECRGETTETIEKRKEKLMSDITKRFEEEKERAYRKWISI